MTQAGQTIHLIYDLEGKRIEEYLFDPVASTSTLIREYVWLDGKPVAVIEGGVIYFVRADHIGRPVFATDGSAAVVWSASYLPFGGVDVTTSTPIALRFPGQWFQAESDLHKNWMRDYDPTPPPKYLNFAILSQIRSFADIIRAKRAGFGLNSLEKVPN